MATPGVRIGAALGHYLILAPIGAGGMGEVYRARDTRLGRVVAIKVLPAATTNDALARGLLLREARTASQLNHPNICTVHEVGEVDGHSYIAMELIEGETLTARLARGPLHSSDLLRYATQLAAAVGHAHEKGVVHRDLKTFNVMITRDDRVKVLDFGLAKQLDSADRDAASRLPGSHFVPGTTRSHLGERNDLTSAGAGTLAYMSPEQLRGEVADARSDVWALGVVLYEMAAGDVPFRGKTALELSSAILHEPYRVLPVGTAPELHSLIDRCLEKNPARRYARAGEVAAVLEAALASRNAGYARRSPLKGARAFLMPGVAISVVVVALAIGLWRRGQNTDTGAVSSEPLQVQQLTSFVGMEWGGSLSPDADFLSYAHNRYGQMDIFVLPVAGGDPVRLTNTPADELVARWSPDGRYIAFLSDRGHGSAIYVVPPLGGSERMLADTGIAWMGRSVESLFAMGPQPWSPDAKQLVFSRLQPTGEMPLWSVDLDTSSQIQLTHPRPGIIDNGASISFDGKQVAFVRNEAAKTTLMLMSRDGGEPQELLADQSVVRTPAWLPDNQRLVFPSSRAGASNLWEIDVRTRRLRQLTSGSGMTMAFPSVSRRGQIAYTAYSHQVDVYWGEIGKPAEKHQRLTAHTKNNFGARVSPDGDHVLYQSDRTGNYELWLLDRRTGAEQQLTDSPGPDYMADWSPDGKLIVFLSARGGPLQVWVMNVETRQAHRISERSHAQPFEPHFSGPRWSPDGKAIGFLASGDKDDTLFIVDPDGGNERVPLPGVNVFDWWRDSRHLIFTVRAADGGLEMRAADLDSGKQTVLLRGPVSELVVARDGRAVAYLDAISHFAMQAVVQKLEVGPDGLPRFAGKPQQITHGEGNWHVHNGGWSPDGRALIYTRDADSGDIFLIRNHR